MKVFLYVYLQFTVLSPGSMASTQRTEGVRSVGGSHLLVKSVLEDFDRSMEM